AIAYGATITLIEPLFELPVLIVIPVSVIVAVVVVVVVIIIIPVVAVVSAAKILLPAAAVSGTVIITLEILVAVFDKRGVAEFQLTSG
ncbi:hypothetical protein, partial [Clostridioides difficile]|uniref:hypothetical protein n=1 Tax=Clostridioides difficile TaxID=1496 RepID=UPI0018DBB037